MNEIIEPKILSIMETSKRKGFTLVELIIVVAIIAILAGTIFVALDPARRFAESRNSQRFSDVNTILDAIIKYQADNDGTHYLEVESLGSTSFYTIGTCNTGGDTNCGAKTTVTSCVDLTDIGTNYLAKVPKDPKNGTDAKTDYYLKKDENDSITIGACDPEGEGPGASGTAPIIEVTR